MIDPKIAAHSGRIVKLMGDGALVEFASAVDAVTCAIEIQRQLREHDAGRSEANPIQFRIGINVGDIIIEGDDIFGDGVNIAARHRRHCRAGRHLDFGGRLAAGARQGGGQLRRCRRAEPEEHCAARARLSRRTRREGTTPPTAPASALPRQAFDRGAAVSRT